MFILFLAIAFVLSAAKLVGIATISWWVIIAIIVAIPMAWMLVAVVIASVYCLWLTMKDRR
jgi:hypothetical protein